MPSLGPKKNMESKALPQLSNEMQLSLMNKVKNGELSIEDALVQAKRATQPQLLNQVEEQKQPTQHNFSVRKHSHYRWQKRILQIDFTTKIVCSIEKGIVKRQLSFSRVKSCDDGVGTRFSISFQDHHDYELEAMSVEEKYKIVQLVNQIIYQNIYSSSAEDSTVIRQQLPEPSCVREGVLLVHRGGLASFKWVKYEVQLHPGQLVLVPLVCEGPSDSEVSPTVNATRVIHLSDGDTRVNIQHSPDIFTLASHKNQYHFRVPDEARSPEAVLKERDGWAQAIDKVCAGWRRKSEHIYASPRALLRQASEEDGESAPLPGIPAGHDGTLLMADEIHAYPPVDYANYGLVGKCSSSGDNGLSCPLAREVKPVPRRRNRPAGGATGSDSNSAPVSPTPSPTTGGLLPAQPSMRPSSPTLTPVRPAPPPPSTITPAPLPKAGAASHGGFVPVAPPLPCMMPVKAPVLVHTKAFHWDQVTPDKIEKSFWNHGSGKKIEIDMPRLKEQFAAQDLGAFSGADLSKAVNVLLDQKIAHNFNIFLKSFPVQPAELKDKLYILNEDEGGLSEEQITALRRFIPTIDDVEKYKSYKGPISELHIVDQYMMEMCNIPYLSSRLDLLLTLKELPISMRDLEPLIIQKISMCTQLYNSGLFVSVLEYLLAIGNYLNKNAGKQKAKGFRLSSLTKLSQLRGRDRKFTLLHALVEQIMLHEPGLAAFTQELAEFETVPGASIKGLTAEVDVLKNELQKVIKYKKTYKKKIMGDQHPSFFKDLKMAIDKYDTDLSLLTKKCEEMKKLYSDILAKFGETSDQDSQELFGMVCQFIHEFRRIRATFM